MNHKQSDRHRGAMYLWIVLGVLLGLALGTGATWWGLSGYHERSRAQSVGPLRDQVLQVQTELDSLYAQRDVLKGQLTVESSTRKGLEVTLDTVQRELGAARDQIAFFYELLPPGPEGSISIRGLDFQQKGNMLQFKVLLMRNGADSESFDGMLQFQANGRIAGDPVTLVLEPVRVPATDADGPATKDDEDNAAPSPVLALKFEQFQRSSGLLQIPEGIELEDVTLNVFEDGILRVSRTFEMAAQPLPH